MYTVDMLFLASNFKKRYRQTILVCRF
jgi:hypothetical protein